MTRLFFSFIILLTLCFLACRKSPSAVSPPAGPGVVVANPVDTSAAADTTNGSDEPPAVDSFTTYRIAPGAQYCDANAYTLRTTSLLHFRAVFDSSAIYTSADPSNQADINKLFGFSDSLTHHHRNSARFGWNWGPDSRLHIHAYIYTAGVRLSQELGTVPLGIAQDYRIEVRPGSYLFALNGATTVMPRACLDTVARGYGLLPYFGGDEAAPHEVRIRIRELP